MPLAIFASGVITSVGDAGVRHLIPGIEPGGSQAGGDTKPALLIRSMRLLCTQFTPDADNNGVNVHLALSQEEDMTPSQVLTVGSIQSGATDTSLERTHLTIHEIGDIHAGTIWAPRFVAIRTTALDAFPTNLSVQIWLDYERIDVPWMDWFIMWDYLDNVVNNTQEY